MLNSRWTVAATALLILSSAYVVGCKTSAGYRRDARLALEAGEQQQAVAALTEGLERNPSNATNRYILGKTLNDLGQPIDAQPHLEIAADLLRDDPDRLSRVLDELARSYFLQGANEQLYAFLEGQTERLGRTSDYLRLARYMKQINDIDAAQSAYERAAYFAPIGDAEPYIELAEFYESINAVPQAVEAYRFALHEDPENPVIAAGLRRHSYVPGPSMKLEPPKPIVPTVQRDDEVE